MSNEEIRKIVALAMITLYTMKVTCNLCTVQAYLAAQGYQLSPNAICEAMGEMFEPITSDDLAGAILQSQRPSARLIASVR